MSIKSEILDIAKDNGYTGTARTITGAINALTDTLAGEDVAGGRTVASAIHKLAPYIGAGGGGGEVGFGAGFMVNAKQSYMTLPCQGANVLVDGKPVLIMPPSNQQSPVTMPSGLTYNVNYSVQSISKVTLDTMNDEMQVISSEDLDYTTSTPTSGSGSITVTFSVPLIDFADGYSDMGFPLHVVSITA